MNGGGNRFNRLLNFVGAIGMVALIGFGVFFGQRALSRNGTAGSVVEDRSVPVHTYVSREVAVQPAVTVEGFIEAKRTVLVSAEVQGVLVQAAPDPNTPVKQGEIIAGVDPGDYTDRVAAAAAEVERWKSLADFRSKESDRATALVRRTNLSPADYDKMIMELADARTMLRAAEARLALAQRELGKSRIASPLTGLVVERLAERGELIQPGKPVARLIEPDPLRFIARLSDRQLATLGDRFRAQVLRVVRAADRRDAKVVRVGPEAERATHLFPVELEIANTQADWLAGSFVRAEFVSANADHVVIVPKTAVFVRFEQTFVYAAEPREKGRDRTKVVERRVQVRDLPGEPELVVVESGVSAGESVVTTGRDFVTAGSTVHVVHEQ